MKNLVIIGAGEFGQEFYSWCLASEGKDWIIKGFLDDRTDCLEHSSLKHRILSNISSYQPQINDVFICAVGSGETRIKLSKILQDKGGAFINYIHSSVFIASPFKMGVGNILGPFVYGGIHADMGNFNFFNVASSIGHHAKIGDGCTLNSHADITGNVTLENNVFLGSHACIIPSKTVGQGAIIGAGSAVMRNVPAGATVVGVPAKRLI